MNWLKNNWRLVAWIVLTGLVVFFYAVLFPARRVRLVAETGLEKPVIDAWLFYAPEQLAEVLPRFTPVGRQYYAFTEFTLDLAFPFLYGTWIFLATEGMLRYLTPAASHWRRLRFGPVILILADLLENSLVSANMLTFPPVNHALVNLTAFISAAKWAIGIACILVLAAAGLAAGVKYLRKQRS